MTCKLRAYMPAATGHFSVGVSFDGLVVRRNAEIQLLHEGGGGKDQL